MSVTLVSMPSLGEYEISTDRNRLDVTLIHGILQSSYWARNVPRAVVERSIEHSLCFGVFHAGGQVAFARVITDFATFAYLADVFVVPEHRRHGVATLLVRTILDHPGLQHLRRFLLATRDAHALYAKLGFQPLTNPENFMSLRPPGAPPQ